MEEEQETEELAKKQLKILYKRNTNGSINQWQIIIKDNSYYTNEGLLNGKITQSKATFVKGKNQGRSNETSANEQAQKEAGSKFQHKIDKGYSEDIKKIDISKKFLAMLAKKYIDYKESLNFPVLVEEKIDGARMIIQKNGLFTRNGKEYVSCPHIHKLFKPFFKKYPDWIVDGEIYSHNIPFEKIMSVVRKSKPDVQDLKESEKIIKIYIFDGVTHDKDLGFEERFKLIKQAITKIIGKSKFIKFVNPVKVNSHKEIEVYHDKFIKNGYEGAIIRISGSVYENKRSRNLLKLKNFIDEEFTIIDIVEGIGNRSGMAGNIVLEMKNGNQFSSGIKGGEEYYRDLLKNKSKFIGKLATIRYQELSSDGIPRFPIAININRVDI